MAGEDWKASLPEDLRQDPSLADIQDVPNLAKGFINAQKLIGRDKIPVPGEDAPPEEWDRVFNRLGRPATPEEYSVEMPETLPEGFQLDDELQKGFLEKAHKLGLTAKQAAGLARWMVDTDIQGYNDIVRDDQLAMAEGEKALRAKWGKAYDQNVARARWLLDEFGDNDTARLIEKAGFTSNPVFIGFLGNIASKMGEDTLKGSGFQQFNVMTPEAATTEIARLRGDKDFMAKYQSKDPAVRKAAIEKMQQLFIQAHPETPK